MPTTIRLNKPGLSLTVLQGSTGRSDELAERLAAYVAGLRAAAGERFEIAVNDDADEDNPEAIYTAHGEDIEGAHEFMMRPHADEFWSA